MPPMHHPDLQALIERQLIGLGLGGRRLSYRQAAERAEDRGHHISAETIRLLATGRHSGRLEDNTIDALAVAVDTTRAKILAAMHEQRSVPLGEWQPPESARWMTRRQRRAVELLISAMVSPASATDDPDVDLVAVGDQGLFVAQSKNAGVVSDDDREANEKVADEKLDRMEQDDLARRRFGGR